MLITFTETSLQFTLDCKLCTQKTLSKLVDRISNAEQTIVLNDRNSYKNILIIDDAIGSGATINVVAEKIRRSGICQGKIIGLAITGSSNGFDAINEV